MILETQSTVHIFSNPALLRDTQYLDDPVNVHPTGGYTHCNVEETTEDFGAFYLHEGRLA